MKRISFLIVFLACLWAESIHAQGPAIIAKDLCWEVNETTDSTVIGYYIFSGRSETALLVNYLNSDGAKVTIPSDATITVGKCCCETAAAATTDPNAVFVNEMCWSSDGVAYQNINRILYANSMLNEPYIILYRDADGNRVDVGNGDEVYYGYCDCCINNPN